MPVATKKIGRYEIEDELGKGPLGSVYRAQDPQKGREVRVKTLISPRLNPEGVKGFLDYAKRTGALRHDGIAKVFAVGEVGGKHFVTSELCPETLVDVIERKDPMSLRARLDLTLSIASALAAAHAQGLVHAGVKAGNVGLKEGQVKLLDFGSGFTLVGVGATDSTRSAPILDSIRYQAPEVIEGQPPDEKSDIYAVGVLLYELLTYERPFAAPSVAGIIKKIVNQQIRALTQIDPSFPPSLDAILARTLARANGGRYSTLIDLHRDLERVASSLPAVKESTRPIPARPVELQAARPDPLAVLASELAKKIVEARQLYEQGDRERCAELMREVEGYTSQEESYPGLSDLVRASVDALMQSEPLTPISPRGNPPDHFAQSHALFTAGDYAACLASLQDLFNETPDHQQGRNLALSVEKAVRAQAEDPAISGSSELLADALLNVGRTALSRGDLQAAESIHRMLQSIAPGTEALKEIRTSLSEARLAALRALPPEPPSVPDEAIKPGSSKSGELRARLKAWLATAVHKYDDGGYVEALGLAYEVVKVDPSRIEALALIEKCASELKARPRAHARRHRAAFDA
ncbi:MAG: serine/threonine-protein kinase [Acidobacteriota bacterium]